MTSTQCALGSKAVEAGAIHALPRKLTAIVICFFLLLLWVSPVAAQTRHIELQDLAKITSVSDPQISPDGKSVVVAVSRPNIEQDRRDSDPCASISPRGLSTCSRKTAKAWPRRAGHPTATDWRLKPRAVKGKTPSRRCLSSR